MVVRGAAELVGERGLGVNVGSLEYGELFVECLADGVVKIFGELNHYRKEARARAEAEFDIQRTTKFYLRAFSI